MYRLKRALVELSLSVFGFQRVQGVFKKSFLEKSKLMPEKYKFDFEFKGQGVEKEFYAASVVTGKKGTEKHNLLLAIPCVAANNHILIYNQNWMLKFFVSGYEKVEALFSHKMFDENIIFAKNGQLASLVLNEEFANRLDQMKQNLSAKSTDLDQADNLVPRIDLAFYEGQLLIYVYDYALYFDPFDTREKPTTTAQDFTNLYERFKKFNETIQILTR